METEKPKSDLKPLKEEKIYWFDFRLGTFQENLQQTRQVLIKRDGRMDTEYARYIHGDVFLECSGVDGGTIVTNQVIMIAEMPVG